MYFYCFSTHYHLFSFRRDLAESAKQQRIEKESYEDFGSRVIDIIKSTPQDVIDRTIDSLPQRMKMVIKSKGKRIKY